MLQRLTENTVCNHSKAISMALGLILFNITVIYNLKFSEKYKNTLVVICSDGHTMCMFQVFLFFSEGLGFFFFFYRGLSYPVK